MDSDTQRIPGHGCLDSRLEAEREHILRYCQRWTHNQEVALDLVQETLIRAWEIRHRLKDTEQLRYWLIDIARNICLRWQRNAGREVLWTLPDIAESASQETSLDRTLPAVETSIAGLVGFKPVLNRLDRQAHVTFQNAFLNGTIDCRRCGRQIELACEPAGDQGRLSGETFQNYNRVSYACDACRSQVTVCLDRILLCIPSVARFWREHRRIHCETEQTIQFEGRPALLHRFITRESNASLEVISDAKTFALQGVFGVSL